MNTRVDTLHSTYSRGERTHQSGTERFKQLISTLALWRERSRQRQALAELSDHELKDIGISRVDAIRESRKSFWQA